MCYFIVVGIPKDFSGKAQTLLPKGLLAESEHEYSAYFREEMSNCEIFPVTDGMCSCSLYRPPPKASRIERRAKKYRKKGWTRQKIARALADTDRPMDRWSGIRADLIAWIGALLAEGCSIYVFVHWSSDGIPRNLEYRSVSIAELREDPQRIVEGQLHKVLPDPPEPQ